jgi:PST family polysaccharide transporter
MKLIKTSFYTSISTAVTFISGFVVTKVVAVKIGPAGISYVGQYQNVIAIMAMFSTLAVTTGVIKYLAEHKEDNLQKKRIISTAFIIILTSSCIISLSVILFSRFFSIIVFKSNDFSNVFFLYGFFIGIMALNSLIAAVYNGLKEIKYLTVVNIAGSLTGIIFTLLFAYKMGVKGVLIANNFTALVIFLINLVILYKKKYFDVKPEFLQWESSSAKLLLGFTLMGIVSGLLMPLSQIFIRNRIMNIFSANEAGWWQAVTRISDYYLAFITTVLSVYYLPRLSEINNKKELKQEIKNGYKIVLPIVGFMALSIWIFKVLIVHILFSKDFLPMTPLFTFQLLGDFFKIGSYLLAYILIAKADIKLFIVSEVLFSLSLVFFSYLFIGKFGVIGSTYAFCVNYALYWVAMFFITKKYLY